MVYKYFINSLIAAENNCINISFNEEIIMQKLLSVYNKYEYYSDTFDCIFNCNPVSKYRYLENYLSFIK